MVQFEDNKNRMLRNLQRQSESQERQLHPNLMKNTKHYYKLGEIDFPEDRSHSTFSYFHNQKPLMKLEKKVVRSNDSTVKLSHNHVNIGAESSLTHNDFVPFRFGANSSKQGEQGDQKQPKYLELGRTGPRLYEYPMGGRDSSSLRINLDRAPQSVTRTQPAKQKQDLMKSGFELGANTSFSKLSMYGHTYSDPNQDKSTANNIQFKYKPRNFDIITGSKRGVTDVAGEMPHHKYEFYDPVISRHRQSFNKLNTSQANPRLDPITGREIAGKT